MIKTNRDKLVYMSLSGKVSPNAGGGGQSVKHNGFPFLGPGTGGICYNVKVGDSAFGWAGDHIEPGVSTRGSKEANDKFNASYNFLACIGNKVKVVSGEAKGAEGVVTGKHGGSERVMVDFDDDILDKLTHDDTFMIKSIGQGMTIEDYTPEEFRILNVDPNLFQQLNLKKVDDNSFTIGVTHFIPPQLMGSGIGSTNVGCGDYDITTQDKTTLGQSNIYSLRLGDIVAIMDHNTINGRAYEQGYVSVGVVIHCDSVYSGHGPGVTTIMSTKKSILCPVQDDNANIAKIMNIGRFR